MNILLCMQNWHCSNVKISCFCIQSIPNVANIARSSWSSFDGQFVLFTLRTCLHSNMDFICASFSANKRTTVWINLFFFYDHITLFIGLLCSNISMQKTSVRMFSSICSCCSRTFYSFQHIFTYRKREECILMFEWM